MLNRVMKNTEKTLFKDKIEKKVLMGKSRDRKLFLDKNLLLQYM